MNRILRHRGLKSIDPNEKIPPYEDIIFYLNALQDEIQESKIPDSPFKNDH